MSPSQDKAKADPTATGQQEAQTETAQAEPDAEALSPEQALEAAEEKAAHFKDLALRAEAEMQNMQRRTARDVEQAHKFGLERFLNNLLPVVDGLEKAIEAAEQAAGETDGKSSGNPDAITEGVRLCHKLLLDVMAKEGIEVLAPEGEPFDPNEQQAMSIVEHPDMEPNSVLSVVQKGYKLNGRLVRPAMVMVSKAPVESS